MCVGDWRLGRLIRSVSRTVAIADIATLVALPSKDRVGILIGYASFTNSVNNGLNVLVDGNIIGSVGMGQPFIMFSMVNHGDLPTHGFSLTLVAGATGSCSMTEFFLPEDYLAAGLEEFRRSYMGGR